MSGVTVGGLAGARLRAMEAAEPAARHRAIALAAFDRHRALHPLEHYTGILSLHALARLAVAERQEQLLERARESLRPFVRGERKFAGNFSNYQIGGNGTALLLWQGHLPEAAEAVRREGRRLLEEAPRSRDGIFTRPDKRGTDAVFIDAAFAVCPFLAFAGRALGEPAFLQEAVQQVHLLWPILRNPTHGLLHQARGFSRAEKVTEDHWSRGNGWGLLAVTELCEALPGGDPRRSILIGVARGLLEACLRFQDAAGLWHQEITRPDSYVETSGSGLILYALGVGLARGWMPARYRPAFDRGIAGYQRYVAADGSVDNTCRGCLSPGAGTIADYMAQPAARNDPHAFGPAILAFGIAAQLARG
ncbi:MAG: glycoside hydrolase family 88 protein [Verrucomicrobia bacterium]|nr:glycoside hydrolase family 88 protein [Verrucomicrobiota bacterium]